MQQFRRPDHPAELEPVNPGHHDVRNYKVRDQGVGLLEPVLSICSEKELVFSVQLHRYVFGDSRGILDYKYPYGIDILCRIILKGQLALRHYHGQLTPFVFFNIFIVGLPVGKRQADDETGPLIFQAESFNVASY